MNTFKHKNAKRRCVILYLFKNERRAEILDRVYEIRRGYHFAPIKHRRKIYFTLPRNEDLTAILIEKEKAEKGIIEVRYFPD